MSLRESGSEFMQLSPQYLQQDTKPGVLQGIVVDVRDPWSSGRCRVHVYSQDGDYPETDLKTLRWSQPMHPGRGSFSPPQLGDRVLVSFEAGDKYAPMILGHVTATPMGGEGTLLPWNKRVGNEIRPECWHNHDLYPEALMLAGSGNGNAIWMTDVFMAKDEKAKTGNLASTISLMDTGGKYFRLKSYHLEEKHWSPVSHFPVGKGTLYKTEYGENEPTRSGFESESDLESKSGSIEMGHKNLKRQMLSTEDTYTLDQTIQKSGEDEIGFDQQAAGGAIFKTRQDSINLTMMQTMMMLNAPSGVAINKLLTPPRRWDDDEDDQSSMTLALFDIVGADFAEMGALTTQMASPLAQMKSSLTSMSTTLTGMTRGLTSLTSGLSSLTGSLGSIQGALGGLQGLTGGLGGSLGSLTSSLGSLGGLGAFAGLAGGVGGITSQLGGIQSQLSGLTSSLGSMGGVTSLLQGGLGGISPLSGGTFASMVPQLTGAVSSLQELHTQVTSHVNQIKSTTTTLQSTITP